MVLVGCFLPLAIYLLILATINRRDRALVVSGSWDFVGILFAVSGFLALGGPAILTGLHEQWRTSFWVPTADSPEVPSRHYVLWVCAFGLYFLMVVVGAAYLIRRQRLVTSIYNVDPELFGGIIARVLARSGVTYQQYGNVLHLRREAAAPEGESDSEHVGQRKSYPRSSRLGSLEVDPSTRFCHVSLRWSEGTKTVRQELEQEMKEELALVEAPDNPFGDTLMIIAGLTFLGILLGVGVLLVLMIQG